MTDSLPPAVRTLILANLAVFILQLARDELMMGLFALWPFGTIFQPWQILSYAFLHGDFAHLFFNMFGLYMFGRDLEARWGSRRFLAVYFASVLAAAAAQLTVTAAADTIYPTVGASGGVFGILLSYALYFPHQRIMLLIPPVPMPAWLFVTLYGLLTLYFGVTNTVAGIAHFAHLGGMAGAALVIAFWRAGNRQRW